MDKYKNSTTWTGSAWRSGETKTIRVPIALEEKIMAYARAIDRENAMSHGIVGEIILSAIADYIKMRQQNLHPNQHSKGKGLSTRSRIWDELRRFESWIEAVRNK
ncbi:MAG: hypothetical protein V7K47_06315 [Nostoc sp.]